LVNAEELFQSVVISTVGTPSAETSDERCVNINSKTRTMLRLRLMETT
jgi:hypothetical protein